MINAQINILEHNQIRLILLFFTHPMSAHQLCLHLQIKMIMEVPHITVSISRFAKRTRKVTLLP